MHMAKLTRSGLDCTRRHQRPMRVRGSRDVLRAALAAAFFARSASAFSSGGTMRRDVLGALVMLTGGMSDPLSSAVMGSLPADLAEDLPAVLVIIASPAAVRFAEGFASGFATTDFVDDFADDFDVAVFAADFAVDFADAVFVTVDFVVAVTVVPSSDDDRTAVDFLDFPALDWTGTVACSDDCSGCCSDCADRSDRSATCLCRSDSLSADSMESDESIESSTFADDADEDDAEEVDVEPVSSDDVVEVNVTVVVDFDRSDRRSE